MTKKSYLITARGVTSYSGAKLFRIIEGHQVGYMHVKHYLTSPNEAFAELTDHNIYIIGAKRQQLIDALADVCEFGPEPIYDRFGWNGLRHVQQSGRIEPADEETKSHLIVAPQLDKSRQSGNLEGWLANVAAPLSGHRVCEFAMTIPFAGPLRDSTNRPDNPGWNFAGEPGCGKSVMMQAMSSACGGSQDGGDGNFGLSFVTTPNGIESEMQYYSDSAMLIDDLSQFALALPNSSRGRIVSQTVMALARGQDKRRFKQNVNKYRFVYAVNANELLDQVIGGTTAEAINQAVEDRLMTVPLFGRLYGVFDHVPKGYSDTGDFIGDLVRATTENHGVAMAEFIRQLVALRSRDPEAFAGRIEHHIAVFRAATGVDANAGSPRRVAEAFGLVYAAGRLAKVFGVLPATYDPLQSTLACYRLHRSIRQPRPGVAEQLRAMINDSRMIDLDGHALPKLSNHELAETHGFIKTNREGATEMLFSPASIRRLIFQWNRVRRDDFEVARMVVRDNGRHTVKREVRQGKKDRMVCIIVPKRG